MTTQSRTVRVFLSSTFRDFAEERDLLIQVRKGLGLVNQ
jgi:hypothetical protein